MGSWHFSSPNWKMHSSLTFFVSLHTQQMRLPAAFVVGAAAGAGADVAAELMILCESFGSRMKGGGNRSMQDGVTTQFRNLPLLLSAQGDKPFSR
jgi:hypothetical protein